MFKVMDKRASATTHGRWTRMIIAAAVITIAALPFPAHAPGSGDSMQFSVIPGPLSFAASPAAPDAPSFSLDGRAQTLSSQMDSITVTDATGTGVGWNLTVSGGYADGGAVLTAGALTLDSSGAGFTPEVGSTGAKPTHQCDSGCFLDAPPASPSKIVAAASGTGMGSFRTTDFSSSSLRLVVSGSARSLPPGELYRVDLSWSLNTGP
jgi:putative surface cell wall-binding protein